MLGLDIIAYDSNYNRLDTFETTTMFLYEELRKNNSFKMQLLQSFTNNQKISQLPTTILGQETDQNVKLN